MSTNQEIRNSITSHYRDVESQKTESIRRFVELYKAGKMEEAEKLFNSASYGVQCQMEEAVS